MTATALDMSQGLSVGQCQVGNYLLNTLSIYIVLILCLLGPVAIQNTLFRLAYAPLAQTYVVCVCVCVCSALFQAYLMRPSIIFFDEIDGLAPVRSSRQDQIHRYYLTQD